jgi:Ca-activated chloride channel family protein
MKTSLFLSHRPMDGGHLVRALLDLQGDPPADESRTALNLALVLDRSGSMAGSKLAAARQAARRLIERLHPDDRVAVVAFDDEVTTVVEPGTAADHEALDDAIATIVPGGMTNLSGGWLRARSLLAAADGHQISRIILLTDGRANVGVTDPAQLRGLAARAASDAGITTTTIGVGSGYDEELTIAMAEAGLGTSYYMERPDQATGIFEEELLGLLSVCAQNIDVRLRPTDAVETTAVLHSYPATPLPDNTLVLSVGDLYAREPRQVLMEFAIEAPVDGAVGRPDSDPVPVCSVDVRADVLTPGGDVEYRELTLPITFTPSGGPVTDPEVRRTWLLLRASAAREEAVRRADAGDLDGATRVLRERSAELRDGCGAGGVDDDEVRAEADDLQATAEKIRERQVCDAADRTYLRTRADQASKGRAAAARASRRRHGDR